MTAPAVQYTRTADGARIAYCVAGNGPPLLRGAVVAATHLEHDWEAFGRVLRPLAARFRIAWYDARGTGLSDRRARDFSLDAMVADMEAVVAAVGFDRFPLLAFANGAPIALAYAVRNPSRVTHLVAVDSLPAFSYLGKTARTMAELDWNIYTETAAKVLLGIDEPAYVRQLAMMYRQTIDQPTYLAFSDASLGWDPGDLTSIRAKTLVLNNRDLPWAPLETSQDIAAAIPDSRLVRIDDRLYDGLHTLVEDFVLGSTAPPRDPSPRPRFAQSSSPTWSGTRR